MDKPNCYDCAYRRRIPGDEHSRCENLNAAVTGASHGIKHGWFFWPANFDPTWLVSCDGFARLPSKDVPAVADAKPEVRR